MLQTASEHVVHLTRLRYWRERAALTQVELAEKAGITQVQLSRIERCDVQPRPTTTRKLAAALDVKPAQLMGPPEESRRGSGGDAA
jgi:transcriptional regulator with XRE-family HTH domain